MSQGIPQGDAAPSGSGPVASGRNLFLLSVLGLFLELLLIRWLSTEIQVFSYLQNTVLVVCFLGLGMGCLTSRKPFVLRELLLPLLVIAVVFSIPVTRAGLHHCGELLHLFGAREAWKIDAFFANVRRASIEVALGTILTFVVLMFVWDVFVPIGRLLGRMLDDHPSTIRAYSINVAGSLAGIWLFVLLSALYQPPLTWMLVVAALVLLLFVPTRSISRLDAGLLAGIVVASVVAGYDPGAYETCWSPYQKLAVVPPTAPTAGAAATEWSGIGEYVVVSGAGPYQAMLDLRPEHVKKRPERYPPESFDLSQYDIPARMQPLARNVLIVGAGSGNDVAGILRHGIKNVTAVDIDPAIIAMGRRWHPEAPYASPDVRVVGDDARSFFATTTERYDLIVFGLLDAHSTTAMTNARLDHYVYTLESLRGARSLLNEGGVLVLTFEVLQPFIPERIFEGLTNVCGHEPVCFRIPPSQSGWGGVMFVAAADMDQVHQAIAADPKLSKQVAEWQAAFPIAGTGRYPPATDDWPYLYLDTPHVPPLFYLFIFVLLALFWRGMRQIRVPGLWRDWGRVHWHFLFLGAAFMLLEVQNVSKAAVVLGNTWQVNAVIISGILTLILVANLIAAHFPRLPLAAVYFLLCGSCVALYGVDLARFAFLPYPVKATVVGGLTSLPMLFSGIIFIRSFVAAPRKDVALGANLMGALAGGLLQTMTFVTGIKALLLVVAALYFAAFLCRPTATIEAPKSASELPVSEPSVTST